MQNREGWEKAQKVACVQTTIDSHLSFQIRITSSIFKVIFYIKLYYYK